MRLGKLKLALVVAASCFALNAYAQAPVAPASAQQNPAVAGRAAAAAAAKAKLDAAMAKPTPRDAKGKPVLVGFWAGPVPGGPGGGQVVREGKVLDLGSGEYGPGGRRPMPADMPKYKPQYRDLAAKPTKQGTVDYADDNQPVTDEVFVGYPPGTPRIGPPHAITQIGDVVVLLYHDLSGPVVRMIPMDGRKARDYVDPSYNGESVGHWDGDTLVIESSNFIETTWLGERGYIHGDNLKVVERITRKGDTLTWGFTATDPDFLLEPWSPAAKTVTLENQVWEEVPPYHDLAAPNLVNTDNHGQR